MSSSIRRHTEEYIRAHAYMRMPTCARDKKFKMADEDNAKLLQKSGASEDVKPTSVLPGALFLTGVTFASIVGGFGYAIGQSRRRSPGSFDQQEGVKLAVRALGWGTVLAVSGVGILVLGVKTALGVKDVRERDIPLFY